jgi:hypothetical protein
MFTISKTTSMAMGTIAGRLISVHALMPRTDTIGEGDMVAHLGIRVCNFLVITDGVHG